MCRVAFPPDANDRFCPIFASVYNHCFGVSNADGFRGQKNTEIWGNNDERKGLGVGEFIS